MKRTGSPAPTLRQCRVALVRWTTGSSAMRRRVGVPAVEALPRLPPKLSLRDHPPEQFRGAPPIATQGGVEMLGDGEPHIEPHHVPQLERPHRVVVAQLHGAINVLGCRDTFLDHPDGLE